MLTISECVYVSLLNIHILVFSLFKNMCYSIFCILLQLLDFKLSCITILVGVTLFSIPKFESLINLFLYHSVYHIDLIMIKNYFKISTQPSIPNLNNISFLGIFSNPLSRASGYFLYL